MPPPDPARLTAATELAARAPVPARWGNVLAGTAGWTDRTLVKSGLFYPRGTASPETRLRHYASVFPLVEVDATYYSLLPPETAERWVAWTPEDFVFDVKAHPVLTGHPIDTKRLPSDLAREIRRSARDSPRVYADGLPTDLVEELERRFFMLTEPLSRAGRLGCVMLQFPPWFRATRGNARRLEALRARHPTTPFSVEFRHASWLDSARRDRVVSLLTEQRLAYVCVDEPDVPLGGVPPFAVVTVPSLALFRFHGQNAAGWRKGASVHERFDYLYSPEELRAWAAPVRRIAAQAASVHAIFNNCVRNYAVLDAQGLSVVLGEPGG